MVVLQPLVMENDTGDQSAAIFRRFLKDLFTQWPGVLTETSFQVKQRAVGADGSVDVSRGSVLIPHNESGGAGFYHVINDKDVNLVRPTAPSPTTKRIDTVLVRVKDSTLDSGGLTDPVVDDAMLEWVIGEPTSSTPVPPTITFSNYYKLANILIPAGATNSPVTSANITDVRLPGTSTASRATGVGGVVVCTSFTRPSPARHGQIIWEEDTKQLVINEGTTSSNWVTYGTSGMTRWKNYSSSFPLSGSKVTTWGRYLKAGRIVFGTAGFRFSHLGTGNLTGRVQCRIPVASANPGIAGLQYIGGGRGFNSTALLAGVIWSGTANVPQNNTVMRDFASGLGLPIWDATHPFDWGLMTGGNAFSKSDGCEMFFCYEAAS
jgi:hypothetical protein